MQLYISYSVIFKTARRHKNVTLKISIGTFHSNLHLGIYYILFFPQAQYSQICARRHKILSMRLGKKANEVNEKNVLLTSVNVQLLCHA